MIGRIHSIESMGLVDGPGIRTVVFFQGCALRCAYCHNPDTWNTKIGMEISSEELLKKILRFKPYFERSGGGVTISGGDPLLQPDFLIEILRLCKENNIHTTVDTSGYGIGKYDEILKFTDLVLLDIKHVSDKGYKELTGRTMHGFYEFLEALKNSDTKLWIRHVVVPGVTDSIHHINQLAKIIKPIKNVEKIELLPYHTLGVSKYESMNLPYRLKDVDPADKEKVNELYKLLIEQINNN